MAAARRSFDTAAAGGKSPAASPRRARRSPGLWRHAGGALALLLALGAAPAAAQQSEAPKRAVVELFTSQGCASCPPADRLICDYAHDASVVVLTLPVTCWDYLGWRDTLAHEKFTKRQRIYAKLRGAQRIYTPQVVVNGVLHMIGSDEAALNRALTPASEPAAALPVKVEIDDNGNSFRVVVTAETTERATVLLAPFYQEKTVAVDGGENQGQSLTYANVVRDLVPLAPLLPSRSGAPVVINLARGDAMPDNTDGFAILVQGGEPKTPGQMLGAATFVTRATH